MRPVTPNGALSVPSLCPCVCLVLGHLPGEARWGGAGPPPPRKVMDREREALAGGGQGGGHCLPFPRVAVQGSCAAASPPAFPRVAFGPVQPGCSSEQNPMQEGKVTPEVFAEV